MAEISIQLDREQDRIYRPGETIKATVTVRTQKDLKCKQLYVRLQLQAHGRGNTTHQKIQEISVFSGTLPPGIHTYQAEFVLPYGPYSYSGHYTNLTWEIQAYIDIPWAIDKKESTHFFLSNKGVLQPDMSQVIIPATPDAHRQKSGTGMLGIAGLVFLPLTLFFLFMTIFQDESLCGCMGMSAVVTLLLGFFGTKRFMASRVVTQPHIHIDPWPIELGKPLNYGLSFIPGVDLELNSVMATLTVSEVVVSGHGTDATTHRHTIHEETIPLTVKSHHTKGQKLEFKHEFFIPEHLPATFQLPSNSVVWTLKTHIDIPRWPDWSDEHTLHVLPYYAKDTPQEQPSGPSW